MNHRRLLGAYYTPSNLAEVLVRWALADNDGTVLDPSYGRCAFLDAAASVLAEKGLSDPGTWVYGVDIDPSCADVVRESRYLNESNCISADFLESSPDDLAGSPFSAIVGNPPYVRHHWIRGGQWKSARAVAGSSSVPLPATASLWAYFLLHSLSFLAPNGRLAMLVPEAILQADYAIPLRDALVNNFANVSLIYIRDRLFAGTNEPVVAVACTRFGEPGCISEEAIETIDDLESFLKDSNGQSGSCCRPAIGGRQADPRAIALLSRIRESDLTQRLSEIATVRVGIVTGANNHFIRSTQELDALEVPQPIRNRIVARTRWLKGLRFSTCDHDTVVREGARAFLVRPSETNDGTSLERWISEGVQFDVHRRYKCASRTDWYRLKLPSRPDAFATCTRLGSPLLVLNQGDCHCSNTVHWVKWKEELPVPAEAIAVGFLTSAVSLWAELNGRRYGGGVLKIEPGTLKRVPVPLVLGAADVFEQADRLLRDGKEEEARQLADKQVLRDGLGFTCDEILRLRNARSELMIWRRPPRPREDHA